MFDRPHILIAEDDELVSELLKEVAMKEGFKVSIAVTGNEAFSLIATNQELYSCVFLDLSLPGMHGKDIIKNLTKLNSRTKIIVYSGFIDEQIYEELKRFKIVVSCQMKPISYTVLRSIFVTILENGEL